MSKWMMVALAVAVVLLVVGLRFLQAADRPAAPVGGPPGMASWWERERMIVKVCNWDGVVPEKALDGFKMPAGKWADYQKQGWQVESYLVAPNPEGNTHGLYVVLAQRPGGMPRVRPEGPPPGTGGGGPGGR